VLVAQLTARHLSHQLLELGSCHATAAPGAVLLLQTSLEEHQATLVMVALLICRPAGLWPLPGHAQVRCSLLEAPLILSCLACICQARWQLSERLCNAVPDLELQLLTSHT
jgi:hypothetical protein